MKRQSSFANMTAKSTAFVRAMAQPPPDFHPFGNARVAP